MASTQKSLAAASSLLARTRSAGQELRAGVEDVRTKISKLKAKKVEIETIPPTLDIALARVDSWVTDLTHMVRERMVEPERFAQSPVVYVNPEIHGPQYMTDNFVGHLGPLLADAVKEKVVALYQNDLGIPESERQQRLEDVDRDLLDAEFAEESIVRAAEISGFAVLRRSNADPRAVLAADEDLP